jgi:CheY-like chemotaxis protein
MESPKILIVDDEPNIRDLLTTSLRFAGFRVQAVGNGAAAISAVLANEPDLIILDVMLPDMNGFSVTKRLREAGYTSPILFLTAKDDTQDKITGLTVGGDDYRANLSRGVEYVCKGADGEVLLTLGRSHEPGGEIVGKRCGVSRNIDRHARLATKA